MWLGETALFLPPGSEEVDTLFFYGLKDRAGSVMQPAFLPSCTSHQNRISFALFGCTKHQMLMRECLIEQPFV